jgi:large subunit ribosomal protein L3
MMMIEGLIGKKVGMTQIFQENGVVTPVTVIEAGPCVVVQRRTVERDGYEAVQLGLVDPKAAKLAKKPMRGHHEKAGVPPTRLLREFRLLAESELKPGDPVSVDIFAEVSKVDVIGASKGKGFQGVMKRHGFGGGRATHGSMFHRAPGSIGQSASPSKVLRGMRGPGRMGSKQTTVKNLSVVRVDAERNLLLVRGAVPGSKGTTLTIRRAKGEAPQAQKG